MNLVEWSIERSRWQESRSEPALYVCRRSLVENLNGDIPAEYLGKDGRIWGTCYVGWFSSLGEVAVALCLYEKRLSFNPRFAYEETYYNYLCRKIFGEESE